MEASEQPGGGCRTSELTLPGFHHDICSAVHPLLLASPAFGDLDLAARGVRLLTPPTAFAHPLDGGRAVCVGGGVEDVAAQLGSDGPAYARMFTSLVADLDKVLPAFLGSMRTVPAHPLAAASIRSARTRSPNIWPRRSRPKKPAPSWRAPPPTPCCPSTAPLSGVFPRLFTALAHRFGWPVVEGGTGALVSALVAELAARGVRIETGCLVKRLDDLPPARVLVLDVTPRQLVEMAGDALPRRYAQRPRPLPLRTWRVQGGLGTTGPRPVVGRRVPAGGDDPRRWELRRDRPE